MKHIVCILALLSAVTTGGVTAAKDAYTARSLSSCADFPTVDEIGETFQQLETDYPEIARSFVIGTSVEGRPLHALRLSADPDEERMEPEVRLIGAIHGNECMAVEICMLAAERFVTEYSEEPFVTRLLDNAEVVMVPLVNPDGYSAERAQRANKNGVDLNRNLYFAWTGGGGPSPFSEPESRALRDFSDDNAFVLGISYHTVSYYVNASWNYSPHHPPDEALFQAVGEGYSGTSTYEAVFGWDWYNIQGDVNDWSLGTNGTFDWTLELTSDVEDRWDVNGAGLEGFLSFVFQGAQGTVTDADTGLPLPARITVSPEGAPIFTDADVGDYNRLLLPGTYSLTAEAQGYAPQTIENVVVSADSMTRTDFALTRDPNAALYAFKVEGMSLPEPIPTNEYGLGNPYLNDTMVWEALGAPDERPFCLSADPTLGEAPTIDLTIPIGSITLDMGEATWVTDGDGSDLRIISATESDDPVALLVSANRDGPFTLLAESSGTFEADLSEIELDAIRYVRLVDLGDGAFNDAQSGYDLDAVENLSPSAVPPRDTDDTDTGDTETDTDKESDGGTDDDIVGDPTQECGCSAPGSAAAQGDLARLFFLLNL